MKILPLSPFLFLFFITSIHQKISAQPCSAGTATEVLDAGNASITLSSSGI